MGESREERGRGRHKKVGDGERRRNGYKESVKRTDSQIEGTSERCMGVRQRREVLTVFLEGNRDRKTHIHKSHPSIHPSINPYVRPSVCSPSICSSLPSFPPRLFPGSGQELLHKPAIHLLLRREASINMSTLFSGVFKAQPVIRLKINKGYPQQQQIRNIPERSRHDTPRSRIIAGELKVVFFADNHIVRFPLNRWAPLTKMTVTIG